MWLLAGGEKYEFSQELRRYCWLVWNIWLTLCKEIGNRHQAGLETFMLSSAQCSAVWWGGGWYFNMLPRSFIFWRNVIVDMIDISKDLTQASLAYNLHLYWKSKQLLLSPAWPGRAALIVDKNLVKEFHWITLLRYEEDFSDFRLRLILQVCSGTVFPSPGITLLQYNDNALGLSCNWNEVWSVKRKISSDYFKIAPI